MKMNIAQFTDGARDQLTEQADQFRQARISVTNKARAEKLASWLHAQGEFAPPIPPEKMRRFVGVALRAFWRSFWRSAGWCVPIIIALEWFARHK